MDRITGAHVATVEGKRQFADRDALNGVHGTNVTAAWLNAIQEEVLGVIEGAGLDPDDESWTQLKTAILALAATVVTAALPLSIPNGGTGGTSASTARAALGAAALGANTDITSLFLDNGGLKLKDTDGSHGLILQPGSNLTADRILALTTGNANRGIDLTNGNITVGAGGSATISGVNTGDQTITLTGPVTGSGTGSLATTIANDAVGNAQAANMADSTIKGRASGAGTGDPTDLTAAQVRAILALGNAYALDKASTSDLLSGAANVMSMDNVEAALAYAAVSFSSTVTLNFNSTRRATFTATSAFTLANPSNMRTGQDVVVVITQDATGGRTWGVGSAWKFPGGTPALSTAANAVDVVAGTVQANGTIRAVLHKASA